MGVSASMAKRTVFLDGEGVLPTVSIVAVVPPDVTEVLLTEDFDLRSCFLNVLFRTPRSRSCCTLMCKAAKAREAWSCSCVLQSLYLFPSIKGLKERTSGRACRCRHVSTWPSVASSLC